MKSTLVTAFCLLLSLLSAPPADAAGGDDPYGTMQALGLTQSQLQDSPARAALPPAQKPAEAASTQGSVPPPYILNPGLRDSDVYGASIFSGSFARQGAVQFNADYLVAVGDQLQIRLWGGFNFDSVLLVDPQGNIFLPNVGPIHVIGVANKDIQKTVEAAVRNVYRANVFVYASLAAAQPVRIFVGGNVMRPGLYDGTSMDSLLHYLDQAGGIDPDRGSFLAVTVKRGDQRRAVVNLYDFLLEGRIPLLQLADGDMIFVPPRQNTVLVSGLVQTARRFEFPTSQIGMKDVMRLSRPTAQATHVRIARSNGTSRTVEYYPLEAAGSVLVENGDEVGFTADKKAMTISVRVEGEHDSPQEYVLAYGSRLGDLLQKIRFNDRSEVEGMQLLRNSVKQRQKDMLAASLRNLEVAVLTARSGSSDEARLRKDEADLVLRWIDRARQVEPLGQVVISDAVARDNLLLENGDIIRVPTRDGLVLVSGEVLFPNAVVFSRSLHLQDYIAQAGGYTQNEGSSRIVLARTNGSYEQLSGGGIRSVDVRPGDQVMVLPKVDEKSRQFWKDMTQIIYQIAISAKVVVGL